MHRMAPLPERFGSCSRSHITLDDLCRGGHPAHIPGLVCNVEGLLVRIHLPLESWGLMSSKCSGGSNGVAQWLN